MDLKSPWLKQVAHKVLFLGYLLMLRLRKGKRLIVLERTSGLGDIICCLPAYQGLKEKFPDHLVVFATAKPYDRLLKHCREIEVVYGAPPGQPFPQEKAAWLVDRHYEPHTSDERIQGGQKMHLAHAFLSDCGLPVTDWQPRISIPAHDQASAARRFDFQPGETIIAIHSGRTWLVRELSQERWQEIVRELKRHFRGRIIHFCTPAQLADNHQPAYDLQDTQLIPENLDLINTAAILAQCRLLVGIDSGLLHLAGAVGTPTVGIFGAVNPQFRLPLGTPSKGVHGTLPCSFCHHETPIKHWSTGCPHDIRCMKEISVAQVIEAAKSVLSQAAT